MGHLRRSRGPGGPAAGLQDYFWPVGGLGQGRVAATGSGSEVLVEYPGNAWGWGYASSPRDPARDEPVQYEEQERVSSDRVWLTLAAIVALDRNRGLLVLGSDRQYSAGSQNWRVLTGERTPFALPGALVVNGVVAETRRTVLVDATDRNSRQAWVRCDVRTFECEIATELDPDDITPQP